jgi:peptidoglycan hydrolase FlgJ
MDITDLTFLNNSTGNIPEYKESRISNTNDVKEAASEFESLLIKQMLDSMRKTVKKTNLLGGKGSNDYFEDLLYHQYAKTISKNTQLGISEMIVKAYQ